LVLLGPLSVCVAWVVSKIYADKFAGAIVEHLICKEMQVITCRNWGSIEISPR